MWTLKKAWYRTFQCVFNLCEVFLPQPSPELLEGAGSIKKLPDFIMLVNPENSTRVVDYSDRSACVLWGDCSSAAIVSRARSSSSFVVAPGRTASHTMRSTSAAFRPACRMMSSSPAVLMMIDPGIRLLMRG